MLWVFDKKDKSSDKGYLHIGFFENHKSDEHFRNFFYSSAFHSVHVLEWLVV